MKLEIHHHVTGSDFVPEVHSTAVSLKFLHKNLPDSYGLEPTTTGCTCLNQSDPTCYSQPILLVVSICSSVAAFVLGCVVTFVLARRLLAGQRRTWEMGVEDETSDSDSKSGADFHMNNPELYESGRYVSINDSREHTYESMRKIVYKPNNRYGEDESLDYLPLRHVSLNRVSEIRDDLETVHDANGLRSDESLQNEAVNHDYFILEPLERSESSDRDMEDSTNDRNETHVDVYVDTEVHDDDYHLIESPEMTNKQSFEDTYESYDEYETTKTDNGLEEIASSESEDNTKTTVYGSSIGNTSGEDYTNILLENSDHLYSGLNVPDVSAPAHSDHEESINSEDTRSEIYEEGNADETYQGSDIYVNNDSETYIINKNESSNSDIDEDIKFNHTVSQVSTNSQDDSVFINENFPDTERSFERFDANLRQSEVYTDFDSGGNVTLVNKGGEETPENNINIYQEKDVSHTSGEFCNFGEQDQIQNKEEPAILDDSQEEGTRRKESHVYINISDIERKDE